MKKKGGAEGTLNDDIAAAVVAVVRLLIRLLLKL